MHGDSKGQIEARSIETLENQKKITIGPPDRSHCHDIQSHGRDYVNFHVLDS